jgi:hypothetical protein
VVEKIQKARNPKRNEVFRRRDKEFVTSYTKTGLQLLLQAREGDFDNSNITAFPPVTRDILLMGTHVISSLTGTEITCWMRT